MGEDQRALLPRAHRRQGSGSLTEKEGIGPGTPGSRGRQYRTL